MIRRAGAVNPIVTTEMLEAINGHFERWMGRQHDRRLTIC